VANAERARARACHQGTEQSARCYMGLLLLARATVGRRGGSIAKVVVIMCGSLPFESYMQTQICSVLYDVIIIVGGSADGGRMKIYFIV
jgi:hypothetical protein